MEDSRNTTRSLQSSLLESAKHLKNQKNASYLKRQDWLARPANFYLKGQIDQGTVLSGCFSCCASIFFFVFVVTQLVGWLTPSFNETISIHYLSRKSKEIYDIPISSFLPTFAVCDNATSVLSSHHYESCNNLTNWDISFRQENFEDGGFTLIDAVHCAEVIQNIPDISLEEKAKF